MAFIAVTRSDTEVLSLEASRLTSIVLTAPIAVSAASVRVTPGTRSVKVFVVDDTEMPAPRSMAASLPARTVAPPSSVEPSAAVRSKSCAAPVAVDSTRRR
jgi:hypothetical protein